MPRPGRRGYPSRWPVAKMYDIARTTGELNAWSGFGIALNDATSNRGRHPLSTVAAALGQRYRDRMRHYANFMRRWKSLGLGLLIANTLEDPCLNIIAGGSADTDSNIFNTPRATCIVDDAWYLLHLNSLFNGQPYFSILYWIEMERGGWTCENIFLKFVPRCDWFMRAIFQVLLNMLMDVVLNILKNHPSRF